MCYYPASSPLALKLLLFQIPPPDPKILWFFSSLPPSPPPSLHHGHEQSSPSAVLLSFFPSIDSFLPSLHVLHYFDYKSSDNHHLHYSVQIVSLFVRIHNSVLKREWPEVEHNKSSYKKQFSKMVFSNQSKRYLSHMELYRLILKGFHLCWQEQETE